MPMSLAQELSIDSSNWLYTRSINDALPHHDVEELAQFIRSSENFECFSLNCPPDNEEFGRHISDAILQNSHLRELRFHTGFSYWFIGNSGPWAIRDMVAWIGSRNTLVNMTSLRSVSVFHHDKSVLDCSALFPLLLTSTSLRKFDIFFQHDNGCSDDVMSALASYLSAASLREFVFRPVRLSEAALTALCNGVALSTVRRFTLGERTLQNFDLETAAESLARMIVESSLEEVMIEGRLSTWSESLISALKLMAPVRNMDFAFTQFGGGTYDNHLRINRKWKPLVVSANTPLALWPHILEKSHVFPETSHGSADIVFYVLRQKPDLVPAP